MACTPYRSSDHLRNGGLLHAIGHLVAPVRYWFRGIIEEVLRG